jgi:hypothetical protein
MGLLLSFYPETMYLPAWKAGTHKNAGRSLLSRLRSQFTQLHKKGRSKEAGTHTLRYTYLLSRRQVVIASRKV